MLAAAGVELGGNYEAPIILPHESRAVPPPPPPPASNKKIGWPAPGMRHSYLQ